MEGGNLFTYVCKLYLCVNVYTYIHYFVEEEFEQ